MINIPYGEKDVEKAKILVSQFDSKHLANVPISLMVSGFLSEIVVFKKYRKYLKWLTIDKKSRHLGDYVTYQGVVIDCKSTRCFKKPLMSHQFTINSDKPFPNSDILLGCRNNAKDKIVSIMGYIYTDEFKNIMRSKPKGSLAPNGRVYKKDNWEINYNEMRNPKHFVSLIKEHFNNRVNK